MSYCVTAYNCLGLKNPKIPILIIVSLLFINCNQLENTKDPTSNNINGDRVQLAKEEKQKYLTQKLSAINVDWNNSLIYLRAFKEEEILEVWTRNNGEVGFKKFLEYEFCSTSGTLGPKRQEGDYQIPEGLYYIDRFNPKSNFHLSLGINYPNKSDQVRGDQTKLGGDIFIHGKCVTIGCIPITDDKIKELYILAEQVKTNGQDRIRVDIFPSKMTAENLQKLKKTNSKHFPLWKEIQPFYEYFEHHKEVPRFSIKQNGEYQLKS